MRWYKLEIGKDRRAWRSLIKRCARQLLLSAPVEERSRAVNVEAFMPLLGGRTQ